MAKAKERKNYQTGRTVKIARHQIVTDGDINPRKMSEDNMKRLRKSIKDNGLVGTLVWNKTTGHIVGGHQRLAALDSLMRTDDYELEVTEVELPERDEFKLNVVLNNTDSQGEFDFTLLNKMSGVLGLDPGEDLGFSQAVIDIQFPDVAPVEEMLDSGETRLIERDAAPEDVEALRQRKKDVREKMKENRDEYGDYKSEPKGVLTIVFEKQSAKVEWLMKHNFEEPETLAVVSFDDFMERAFTPPPAAKEKNDGDK